MSFKVIFIDTNIFLHYQSFDEIDWLGILNVERAEIYLASIVIQELDKHKYSSSSKLRDKASRVIKKLHKLADAGLKTNIKPNIDLCFEINNKTPNFSELSLDPNSQDDRLLASILLFRTENPEKTPVLVAADLGIRLKAKYHQIETICLPDKLKLVGELDQAEKRIKELEREVLELQRKIPKLELCFADRADRLTCKIETPLPESIDIDAIVQNRVERLKQEYPKLIEEQSDKQFRDPSTMTIGKTYGSDTPEILPSEILSYNKKLEEFYESQKQYLEEYISWFKVRCRTFILKISIFNSGNCPAEDIDVSMHFPDGFVLCEPSNLPSKPEEPQPPSQLVPRTRKERLNFARPSLNVPAMSQVSSLMNSQSRTPPNISIPDIRRSNSYDVKLHVRKLKQNTLGDFIPMVIMFDSLDQISSFQIDYQLVASNIPVAVIGKLHVIFNRDSES